MALKSLGIKVWEKLAFRNLFPDCFFHIIVVYWKLDCTIPTRRAWRSGAKQWKLGPYRMFCHLLPSIKADSHFHAHHPIVCHSVAFSLNNSWWDMWIATIEKLPLWDNGQQNESSGCGVWLVTACFPHVWYHLRWRDVHACEFTLREWSEEPKFSFALFGQQLGQFGPGNVYNVFINCSAHLETES